MSSRGVTRIRDIEDFDSLEAQYGNYGTYGATPTPQPQLHPQPQHSPETQIQLMDPNPHRYLGMSCIDIANHIHYCPICSKLYHCDKRAYITAIVFLAVVVVILLRKVLD